MQESTTEGLCDRLAAYTLTQGTTLEAYNPLPAQKQGHETEWALGNGRVPHHQSCLFSLLSNSFTFIFSITD